MCSEAHHTSFNKLERRKGAFYSEIQKMNERELKKVYSTHRYTREIPEPAPFLFWHGAQIGGLWGFLVTKITVVRQVRMSRTCTAV